MTDPKDHSTKGPFRPPRDGGSVPPDMEANEMLDDMIATAELRSRMRHPSYIPASERMAMWNREHQAL